MKTTEEARAETQNLALMGIIRRLRDNMRYDPVIRCHCVSDVAWFDQPYMGKTLAQWLDDELSVAAAVTTVIWGH